MLTIKKQYTLIHSNMEVVTGIKDRELNYNIIM